LSAPAFVVDCSVTMAWCFADGRTARTDAILDRLESETAIVPILWPIEVANVLLWAERKGRLTVSQTVQFTKMLRALPIEISAASIDEALDVVLPLARSHGLSSYDASYLALALHQNLPIATMDKDLLVICPKLGVVLL